MDCKRDYEPCSLTLLPCDYLMPFDYLLLCDYLLSCDYLLPCDYLILRENKVMHCWHKYAYSLDLSNHGLLGIPCRTVDCSPKHPEPFSIP